MIEVNGKYTNAKIMTDIVEPDVIKQVQFICNHPLFENKVIRVMPDCHPGKATIVGLCAEIDTQHIIPQLLGVDIYCSISAWEYKGKENDWSKLDKVIKGMKIKCPKDVKDIIEKLCEKHKLNSNNYINQFGTLGNGNHFCSVEHGENGKYLLIHSGSRSLGYDIAVKYAKLALEQNPYKWGEEKQLSWLNPESSIEYQKDIIDLFHIVTQNHNYISDYICKQMKWKIQDSLFCPHNFIDLENKILHKGSIRLGHSHRGIIPINMADGTLVVRGYDAANLEDWLYSAPHGAGRIISRGEAKEKLDMKEYKNRMKNIYSSGINVTTIDESPMAYKPIEQIKEAIECICQITDHLIPVYNYKQTDKV